MARRPAVVRYSEEMNRLGCPYLVRETVTYRESLDLSRAAPTRVMVNWYCGHPFHGIRLDLGDAEAEVDERCADCALPPPATLQSGRTGGCPRRRGRESAR